MSRRSTITLAATAVLIVLAAVIAVASIKHRDGITAAAAAHPSVSASSSPVPRSSAIPQSSPAPRVADMSLPATPISYLGVYEGSSLTDSQYAQVEQFAQAVGRQPNLVMYYSGWGEGFSIPYAQTALAHGATLVVDIDPTDVSLTSISAGAQDVFLQSFAASVRQFGHPVVISFGHEMNGNWYPWGWTHAPPAEFVAAWRHIVDVFRSTGADNVTWLWTINSIGSSSAAPLADYWPGASYVTWVGLDAYYYESSDDFSGVFDPTISAIRQVTGKPILIAETAIGQVAGQAAKIPSLFAGVAGDGLLGFVWFDVAQDGGLYKQDWRLEGHPYALAAFRNAAAQYLK